MIYLLAHVVASMLAGMEGETMSVLEERFREAEIVNLAEELGAGLVVMGSRGSVALGGRSWAASPIRLYPTLIARFS
jgi:nucleotide-binding universal stress UspA family protein